MACIYTEHENSAVAEVCILGRLTQYDIEDILPKLAAFIEKNGKIRLLEVVESLEGVNPGAMLDGLVFDVRQLANITHAAVVTDMGWIGVLTRAASMVLPITIRIFPNAEWDKAAAWVSTVDTEPQIYSVN